MYTQNLIKNSVFILLLTVSLISAQSFGKNKVHYRDFDWHYVQSEHFDVYFYRGAYKLATFVAREAERDYRFLKKDFGYSIKKRITIVLYKSHNDWQETNVVDTYLPEGVGGVTELFKNRVVIPFEGSYAQLRHVLHHELVHAVMNDMLYGGSIQSIVSGQVSPVPLWFAEGLAEYFSVGWDIKAEMFVRDATINNMLPPIKYLNYYLAYQGGMSVFRYISHKYGREKIAEIIHKMNGAFRLDGAFKSALGIDLKELSEDWQKQMRKDYWPSINRYKESSEIARALTDHKKEKNYLNIAPAISPTGDKLVFLSNMDGNISIYLMDIIEEKIRRKLIEGESDVDFEELHWLSPGMSWSPDGNKVTFAAKAGDRDALYIYDVVTDKVKQYKFDLDGVFSAIWSPKGNEIVFTGLKNEASDLYLFDVKTHQIKNITNDIFTDVNPEWSPDGERIVFVSDRTFYVDTVKTPKNFTMADYNFMENDIYVVNRDGSNMRRITHTKNANEDDPIFSPDGKKLMYVSDRTGIYNIYIHDLSDTVSYPVTNLISGAFQLSIDKKGETLVFSSFSEGGWDIYKLENPFDMKEVKVDSTDFVKHKDEDRPKADEEVKADSLIAKKAASDKASEKVADYEHYVFSKMGSGGAPKLQKTELKEEEYKFSDGNYKVRRYRVKFSPDIIDGAAEINTLWGFQAYTQLTFSDVLGNHRIMLGTNLVFDLRNSQISAQYWYLPKRINWGTGLFNYSNTYYSTTFGLQRFRNYGITGTMSYPFDKFKRFDFSVIWLNADLEFLQINKQMEHIRAVIPTLQYVYDKSEWGMFAPLKGFRGLASLKGSPKYTRESLEFTTLKFDLRKYFQIYENYSFAARLATGFSRGADPQNFYLGGVPNWLNGKYIVNRDIVTASIKDVYFAEFVMPLRGAYYYQQVGNNFMLVNLEFRFPFIPYMQLGMPPIVLGNIQGVLFSDIGMAWKTGEHIDFFGFDDGIISNGKNPITSIGVGLRTYFIFMLKWDVAWRYNTHGFSDPIYYWSMGIDF